MIISHLLYITFTGYLCFDRIYFKILILTFKAIYNISPSYISNFVSNKSCSVCSLRSYSSLFLDCPKGRMLSTLGARAFYAAAPTLWNSLPVNIREITSLSIFKEKRKIYLFNLAYNKYFFAVSLGGGQFCVFRIRFC